MIAFRQGGWERSFKRDIRSDLEDESALSQLCGNWGRSIWGREISSTQFESGKELSIFENLKVACVNGA